LTIQFQHVSPSRLYWADHPAMRVVQALYWLRDMLPTNKDQIFKRLLAILRDPNHGMAIQDDLRSGLPTLPEWLQELVRQLLKQLNDSAKTLSEDDVQPRNKVHNAKGKQ
jgi:hypothetical protein